MAGWREQYDRVKRWRARLEKPSPRADFHGADLHLDDILAFFQNCWHLKDWLKNDPTSGLATTIEADVKRYDALMVCADVANGAKHLRYGGRPTRRGGADISRGEMVVLPPEERIIVSDAKTVPRASIRFTLNVTVDVPGRPRKHVLVLADDALAAWDTLLRGRGLIT